MTFQHVTAAQWNAQPKRSLKYNNRPVVVDGERYDSEIEYNHHMALKRRQLAGEIRRLQHEPEYRLVIDGEYVGSMFPDHVFQELQSDGTWKTRIVDTKSKATTTPYFKFKAKVFKAVFGIEIELWGRV